MKKFSHYLPWILFGIIVLLVSISIFLLLSLTKPLEVRELSVSYYVGENVGFDLNRTALNFGKLVPGSSSTRSVTIDNYYSFPVKVDILASDSLMGILSTEPYLIVDANSSRNLSSMITIPSDYPMGNYTGRIMFVFNKNQ